MAQSLKLSRDQLKVICHDDANAIKQFEKLFAAASSSTTPGGGAVVADGDYLDITVSDDGLTWTINPQRVTTSKIADDAVTDAKLRPSDGLSVIGNPNALAGGPQDIVASTEGDVLQVSGGVLTFAQAPETLGVGPPLPGPPYVANLADVSAFAPSDGQALLYSSTTRKWTAGALPTVAPVDAQYVTLATNATLTNERVLTAGSGISIVDAGAGSTVTVSTTGAPPTGSAGGDLTGTYPNPSIANDAVTTAKILDANVTTAKIADNAVTNGKIRDSAALSVIGRSANSTGDPADIAAGTDGHVLRRSGTTLGFGTVATAGITNDAVTNAKLANMATARIKGRVTAGTGDPEDLTGTQATTLLDAFTSSLKGLAPASGGGTLNYLRADGTWAQPTQQAHVTSDALLSSGAVDLTATLVVGTYKVHMVLMIDVVGGSGGDGAIVNNNNATLVLSASNYSIVAIGSTVGTTLQFPLSNASVAFAFVSDTSNRIEITGIVDVTTGGTLDFEIAEQGSPTSATLLAGSFLTVTRIG